MPDTFLTAAPHWRWLIVLYFFIGGIAGGGTGAAIGLVAGAATGTAVAASGQPHLKIPAETRLQFVLQADWKIQ